jgi:hypothetical protein
MLCLARLVGRVANLLRFAAEPQSCRLGQRPQGCHACAPNLLATWCRHCHGHWPPHHLSGKQRAARAESAASVCLGSRAYFPRPSSQPGAAVQSNFVIVLALCLLCFVVSDKDERRPGLRRLSPALALADRRSMPCPPHKPSTEGQSLDASTAVTWAQNC